MSNKKQEYIPTILPATLIENAVKNAKEEILRERKQEQLGLKTRWDKVNRAVRKYFRFAQIYLIAGLSGHGKSYFLNELINDFLDKKGINKEFKSKVIILYFCYEMSAVDEVLRTLGSKMNTSYGKILSSQWDKDTQSYLGLSDQELKDAFDKLDSIGNRPIFYFETAGNLAQLETTVKHYKKAYKDYKVVVAIDHTLLSEKLNESSELELMANTGKTALRLKKLYGCMVILLGQLNNNIENYLRINDKKAHYPIKSDIYAQGQLYNACDSVITIHQPQLLKIDLYGLRKLPTLDLIHLQFLKARHGITGSVWLENRLNEGTITEKDFNKTDDIPI